MSRALPAQADKPRYVAAMFGRVARRYDLMNTLMTAGQDAHWRRLVARAATTRGAERILDVGTGTGRLGEALLKANRHAEVVGVDFTEGMLRRARRRDLHLTRADALQLPFADHEFDAVVSAFLVRNLADVGRGIAEQTRVLKPGGRLVVLETTPWPSNALRPLVRAYFQNVVPLLGTLIAGEPAAYAYLPESTLAFLEPSRLAQVFGQYGLWDVQVRRLALGSVAMISGRNRFRLE
jgi:demethylmenaquinone methyltransferase/2-methoxy-6-polyprenyl-1,4-benzoquinol methylase